MTLYSKPESEPYSEYGSGSKVPKWIRFRPVPAPQPCKDVTIIFENYASLDSTQLKLIDFRATETSSIKITIHESK